MLSKWNVIPLTLLIPSLLSSPAHAAPTAWPNGQWNLSSVKNGTSSTLLSDSADRKQVWVLPPSTGRIDSPRLVAQSANLGFCQNMANIQVDSRRIAARSAALTLQFGEQEELVAQKQSEFDAHPSESAKQSLEESIARLEALQEALTKKNDSLMMLYSQLGKLEGGFAEASYLSGWDNNITVLREKNPGYVFSKIPTQRARLYIGFPGGSSPDAYLSSLPAVLSYAMNGRSYDPYGNSSEAEMPALPSDMSASYRLSLIGACPIVFPETFGLPKDHNGIPNLNVVASYEYPMMFHSSARFSYNLYAFYQQIKKTGERGYLFWKKSYTEVVEKKIGRDSFVAKWEETDPDNTISFDRKMEIEKEIKADLMARVLRMIAVPRFDGAPPNLPAVPVSAAVVLADGLQGNCFMQSYACAGASWALRGINAMFGNASSESSFKSETDMTSTEEWDMSTARWKPAVSTFISDRN